MTFDYWLVFSIIGIIIPLLGKIFFHTTITKLEFGVIALFNTFVVAIVIFAGTYNLTHDKEIHNGFVLDKQIEKVSCSHSYTCNCRTVSCGKGCSTTHCDTCYEHSHDYDHVVKTTVGDVTIEREDRQGKKIPERWKQVKIEEPVSLEKSYTNYIKASPDSLFNLAYLNDENTKIPDYPRVFDYYRINRVINESKAIVDTVLLNNVLNGELKTQGKRKEVNSVVIFWDNDNDKWVDILKAKWLNGKQNDVIVAIKTKEDSTIESVESFGFSKDSSVYYRINRELKEIDNVKDKEIEIGKIITNAIEQNFVRQSMEDFAYLEDHIDPPTWAIILAALLSIFGTSIASYYAHRKDWFGTERKFR